jgi:YbgC/YbaW family acyl-CoA thioester hydrolase
MPAARSSHSRFETVVPVRPSDLDLNGHVHNSHYLDYVLAARYDQMARCYGMAMEEFLKLGLGWVVRTAHLDYQRPLRLGDHARVITWVEEIAGDSVRVGFEIHRMPGGKPACAGWFVYTLVSARTGRAQAIPEWIAAKYSV